MEVFQCSCRLAGVDGVDVVGLGGEPESVRAVTA
jgi:hypothetical protein